MTAELDRAHSRLLPWLLPGSPRSASTPTTRWASATSGRPRSATRSRRTTDLRTSGRRGWSTTSSGACGSTGCRRQKSVKHRVHLDVYTRALADLEALGATALPTPEGVKWTIMADPEGGEFCAFLRDPLPARRLHGLVVDCVDAPAQSRWWYDVLGGRHIDEGQWGTVTDLAELPDMTFDFVPVPEPKTAAQPDPLGPRGGLDRPVARARRHRAPGQGHRRPALGHPRRPRGQRVLRLHALRVTR